jgi:hypothetical protein
VADDFGVGESKLEGIPKADIELKLLTKMKEDQQKMLNDPNSNGELTLK